MKVTFLLITLAISAPFYECEHEGQMICQGKGFDTCDHGAFVYRECGKGTACKSQHGNVFCDYNQDYEHDDDEDYHRNSHDDHRNRPDEFDDDYKGHDHQRDDDDDHQRDEIHRVREDEKHKHQEDINEKPIHNIQFVATESSPGTICNLANYENNPKLQKCYSVCCSIGKGDCENCKTSKILALENSLSPVSVSSPLLTGGFTISGTVAAIVLMVTGLVFVFFGHKLFKPILFIAGTYFFGLLTFAILVNIESKQGLLFGTNRPWAFPVVCLAAGIVGGLLLVLLWRLGLAAIGGLLGFVVSVLILSVVSGGLLSSEIARYVFTGVLVLIGAILILFIERPILILGTAFPGSYAIFFGLDTFINTGFNQALQSFFGTGVLYVATPAVYGMMAGTVLLALLGCGIQYRGSANSKSYRERAGYNNVPSGYVQPKV